MAANQVNINLQVTNRNDVPYASIPAKLYQPNPSIIQTGTTDGAGRILFTGIAAGTYDIGVTVSGTERLMTNYVVKNEYSVSMGTTSFNYESSSYVRDQETELGGGIESQNKAATGTSVVYGTEVFSRGLLAPISGSFLYEQTVNLAKQTGNSYFYSPTPRTFVQNAKIRVD